MQSPNLPFSVLLPLLLVAMLGCAEDDETPAETLQPTLELSTLPPQDIAQIALKSTVLLRVNRANEDTFGSGFFVGDNQIVTNYHVINGVTSATVESVFHDTKYPLTTILIIDEKHDLAIVASNGLTSPSLPLGDSRSVRIGDTVYVIGNPGGWKGTFSLGIISGIRPDGIAWVDDEVFQMTAPTSHGSSGGPVLNTAGEVIGVHTGTDGEGADLNFVIPVNFLKTLLKTIQ